MAKLYIHIGLHKTATTALQKHTFPYIEEYAYYARNLDDKSSLYHKICSYCFQQKKPTNIADIKNDMRAQLRKGNIILSEEWFTSDYCGQFGFRSAPWQERLCRLAALVEGFDFEILVTSRNPLSGLFSFYCEMHKVGITDKYGSFKSFILNANDAVCYDTLQLRSFILNVFSKPATFLSFELLKDNPDTFFIALSKWLELPYFLSCDLEKTNTTDYQLGKAIVKKPSKIELVYNFVSQHIPLNLKARLKGSRILDIRQYIANTRKSVPINGPTQEEINIISQRFCQVIGKTDTSVNSSTEL